MAQYLIPTTPELVESLAKSIAKDRLRHESKKTIHELTGIANINDELVDFTINSIFDSLWEGTTPEDTYARESYRQTAITAIRTINLNLMTSSQ